MWKKEFVNLLFNTDADKINIQKAHSLKYKYFPLSLYKYRPSYSENDSLNLRYDKIRLTNPENFNDPFDCSISVSKKTIDNSSFHDFINQPLVNRILRIYFSDSEIQEILNSEHIRESFFERLEEKYPNSNFSETKQSIDKKFNNNFRKDVGKYNNILKNITYVTCYSETNDSIPMWSHYANNHKGFCVEYNFKELNPFLNNFLYPVIYDNEILDLSEFFSVQSEESNLLRATLGAITKSKVWEYEDEWRFVFLQKSSDKSFFQITPKPKAIYLGARFEDKTRNLLDIAKERNITVYKMSMKKDEFKLVENKIEI